MLTFKRRSYVVFLIAALSLTAVVVAVGYSQKEPASVDEVTHIIQRFHDEKSEQRAEAFYQLIEKGLGRALAGQTYLIPQSLSRTFKHQPTQSDQIKVELIGLLERESSYLKAHFIEFQKTGKTLSHEYTNYHGDLIAAVAALQDVRAVNGLVEVITTGNLATQGLAMLGDNALDAVIEKLGEGDELVRNSATRVLKQMLEMNYENKVSLSSSAIEKLKAVFIKTVQDNNHYVRIAAVEGLTEIAKRGDTDVLPLIEQIALGDTYKIRREKEDAYPVREVAKKSLRSIRPTTK